MLWFCKISYLAVFASLSDLGYHTWSVSQIWEIHQMKAIQIWDLPSKSSRSVDGRFQNIYDGISALKAVVRFNQSFINDIEYLCISQMAYLLDFYHPLMKLWEGNVFTPLCLSTRSTSIPHGTSKSPFPLWEQTPPGKNMGPDRKWYHTPLPDTAI